MLFFQPQDVDMSEETCLLCGLLGHVAGSKDCQLNSANKRDVTFYFFQQK